MNQDALQQQVVVITGGSRGLGLAVGKKLKSLGAHVALCARNAEELQQAERELSDLGHGKTLTRVCDVSKPEEVDAFIKASASITGSLFGVITAAGHYGAIGAFSSTSFEEWENGVRVNLIGTAKTVHAALPYLRENSRIVLFSGGGQGPMPHFSSYVTSKGGIWRLTETLAAELAPRGIFVNAIAPGAINTKFLDDLIQAGPEKVGEAFYRKSLAQKEQGGESPERAAELVAWLMSDASKGLFGKTISAIWDPYNDWTGLRELSAKDLYCYRRVVPK
jgi:3-oxoacyl-[acyl-carrier protein] reductase